MIKETEYKLLHDKKGVKFFCYSNIFPIGDMKTGDKRNVIVSSPDAFFIKILKNNIEKNFVDTKSPINIGEMQFEVSQLSLIGTRIRNKGVKLISATPIVIRIPEKNYDKYQIPENYRKKGYVYWRPQYSFEAFVKQLEENLIKKYNEFYKTNFEIERIFEIFKFIKSVVNHVIIDGREQMMVGSIWEFQFSYLNPKQKKILEFGIDAGFGERNSLGFGFMRVR